MQNLSFAPGFRPCTLGLLAASILAGGAAAHAQAAIPDAQIEASVLKTLAGAPDLASQSVATNTVDGVVTLSGSVQDDNARIKAENLAANTPGVKKVVDQLQVGSAPAPQQTAPGRGMVLQSDGTYAPASSADQAPAANEHPAPPSATQPQRNDPDHDQALDMQQEQQQQAPVQPAPQPAYGQSAPVPQMPGVPNGYPQNRYPAYPPRGYAQPPYAQNGAPYGGQVAGQNVTVPGGSLVRVRMNRLLASDRAKPGDTFDGTVAYDVVAGGFVAIPRGTQVQGTVVDAHPSGSISGRGELTIQLTSIALGGQTYPLTSDVWKQSGPSKTGQTIGNAAGLGLTGALIGALVGRGGGAAIGAGVGTAAGIGASAASGKGQVIIPPEGIVSFALAAPLAVRTVSEQEIQRLAYGAGPGNPGPYPPAYGYGRRPIYVQPYPGYYPPPPPPPYYPPTY